MKTMIARSAIAVALGVLAVSAGGSLPVRAQTPPASVETRQAPPPLTDNDRRFRAVADEEWAWRQTELPSRASKATSLPDVSAATQQRRLAYWSDIQSRLNAMSPDHLSPSERTNYAVYKHQIDSFVDDGRHRLYEMPFNADSSFWSDLAAKARGTFASVDDYEG